MPSQLDLMMVSSQNLVESHGQLPAEAFSYHDLVYLSFKIRPPKAKPTIVMRRSFRNFDNDKFMEDLSDIDWETVFAANSIDDKLNIFNSILIGLYDIHAPLRPIKIKHLPAPWLTNDIKALMSKRNAAKGKYKLNPSAANLIKYKKLRNQCSRLCRDAQRKYIHSSVDQKNTGKTWQFLASLGVGRQRQHVSHATDLDGLNKHFATTFSFDSLIKQSTLNHLRSLPVHGAPEFQFRTATAAEIKSHIFAIKSDAIGCDGISRKMLIAALDYILPILCHILNFSLTSASFPRAWYKAYIIPIPKVLNPLTPSNYRPISILPFLSKFLNVLFIKNLAFT
ncbi:jg4221 [Pararge aegeria aegeria]|uniref:Jg4221 protein n=1 Tax=Pararge aegeria aegeria TaxID=348720 RepID=A0A8S4R3V8_9NEOP|nr:jg4221 [Pararge aegeria aegeria]